MFQVTTFGYTINELTVTPTGVNTTFYQSSGEWNLEGHSTKDSYNGNYSLVSYSSTVNKSRVYLYFCLYFQKYVGCLVKGAQHNQINTAAFHGKAGQTFAAAEQLLPQQPKITKNETFAKTVFW